MLLPLISLLPLLTLTLAQTTPHPESYALLNVSLLTDLPAFQYANGSNVTIRSVLRQINGQRGDKARKGGKFWFGSTLSQVALKEGQEGWTGKQFDDTWNIAVAENDCKMFSTQPNGPGGFNLSACLATRDWAYSKGVGYRGHNTLWHSQRPDWLVSGNYTAEELVEAIIPQSVEGVIEGLGSGVYSWDVVNEPWTDNAYPGMNESYCVLNATRWPNFAIDGMANSTVLFSNSSWIDAALLAADKARSTLEAEDMGLYINDYNVGGGAKGQCALKTLRRLVDTGVPVDGLGIQSHYSARVGVFPPKAEQHWMFDQLNTLGLKGAITEMDVWMADNSTTSTRFQAAIFGDVLDVCLYSENCNEFLVWDTRDDQSWLADFPDRGVAKGTLFDAAGLPKLAYYEVLARLQNYAAGGDEPCATSGGVEECVLG